MVEIELQLLPLASDTSFLLSVMQYTYMYIYLYSLLGVDLKSGDASESQDRVSGTPSRAAIRPIQRRIPVPLKLFPSTSTHL